MILMRWNILPFYDLILCCSLDDSKNRDQLSAISAHIRLCSSKSHSFEGVNWIFVEEFKMHKNNSRRAQKTLKKITCQFSQYPLAFFHHITDINLSLGFLFFPGVLSSPFCPFNESKQSSSWFCNHKIAQRCCLTVTMLQCVYGGIFPMKFNFKPNHSPWDMRRERKNFRPSTETVWRFFISLSTELPHIYPMNVSPSSVPNVIIELHNCTILLTIFISTLCPVVEPDTEVLVGKPTRSTIKLLDSPREHSIHVASWPALKGKEVKEAQSVCEIRKVVFQWSAERWIRSQSGFFFC